MAHTSEGPAAMILNYTTRALFWVGMIILKIRHRKDPQ